MRQEMTRFWDDSSISWTICKQSATCSRQITPSTSHHSIFTGWMLFLMPNHVKAMKDIQSLLIKRKKNIKTFKFMRKSSQWCEFMAAHAIAQFLQLMIIKHSRSLSFYETEVQFFASTAIFPTRCQRTSKTLAPQDTKQQAISAILRL